MIAHGHHVGQKLGGIVHEAMLVGVVFLDAVQALGRLIDHRLEIFLRHILARQRPLGQNRDALAVDLGEAAGDNVFLVAILRP